MKRNIILSTLSLLAFVMLATAVCMGQSEQQDPLKRVAVYRLPEMDRVDVKRDVTFKTSGTEALKMDLYYPIGHKSGAKRPVVIFLNGVGNRGPLPLKEWGQYTSWPRLVASNGMIAISHDSRQTDPVSDVSDLIAYLRTNAASLDVDDTRICIWSCSANVRIGLPLVLQQQRGYIRAAVFYYGTMDANPSRSDVPMLVVRAGYDVPGINNSIDEFATKALASDVPLTLVNYVGAQHGFDLVDDNEQSREVIRQTIDFMKFHLSKTSYEASKRAPTPTSFSNIIAKQGIQRAVQVYNEARPTAPGDVLFRENTINALGYELLQDGKTKDAIELFKLNVSAYPESANVYDSLSEAYEADGNKELAIQNAERALKLLDGNQNIPDQLRTAIKDGSSNRIKKLKGEN